MKNFASIVLLAFFSTPLLGVIKFDETPTKSQGRVGFCWAYSTVALLEKISLNNHGEELNLSEEYIGLNYLAHQIARGAPLDLITEGGDVFPALELIDEIGVVPDEVFTYKMEGDLEHDPVGRSYKLKEFLENYRKENNLKESELISKQGAWEILTKAFGLKNPPPKPEDTFVFKGKVYTPKTFYQEKFGTKSNDFTYVLLVDPKKEPKVFEKQIRIIQKAILLGYRVPLTYTQISSDAGGSFTQGRFSCTNCKNLSPKDSSRGHVVVLTDYKTQHLEFGEVEKEKINQFEHELPEMFLIRNSWGMGMNSADGSDGVPRWKGYPSMTTMSLEYLIGSISTSDNSKYDGLGFDLSLNSYNATQSGGQNHVVQNINSFLIPAFLVEEEMGPYGKVKPGKPSDYHDEINLSKVAKVRVAKKKSNISIQGLSEIRLISTPSSKAIGISNLLPNSVVSIPKNGVLKKLLRLKTSKDIEVVEVWPSSLASPDPWVVLPVGYREDGFQVTFMGKKGPDYYLYAPLGELKLILVGRGYDGKIITTEEVSVMIEEKSSCEELF